MTRLGVVAALSAEARCLVSEKLRPGECIALDGGWLQLSGIGPQRAARAAHTLLNNGSTALLSWGVAGALDPTLSAGHLLLPQRVLTFDGKEYSVDPGWHARLGRCLGDHLVSNDCSLVESRTVLTMPEQKTALRDRSGAMAVDMESAAIAAVAAAVGVPFLAVRVILDPVHRVIPAVATRAFDADGKLRWRGLGQAAFSAPDVIWHLVQLRQDFRKAKLTLRRVAKLAGPDLQVK